MSAPRSQCECDACQVGDASDPCTGPALPLDTGDDEHEPLVLSAQEMDDVAESHFGALSDMHGRRYES